MGQVGACTLILFLLSNYAILLSFFLSLILFEVFDDVSGRLSLALFIVLIYFFLSIIGVIFLRISKSPIFDSISYIYTFIIFGVLRSVDIYISFIVT